MNERFNAFILQKSLELITVIVTKWVDVPDRGRPIRNGQDNPGFCSSVRNKPAIPPVCIPTIQMGNFTLQKPAHQTRANPITRSDILLVHFPRSDFVGPHRLWSLPLVTRAPRAPGKTESGCTPKLPHACWVGPGLGGVFVQSA